MINQSCRDFEYVVIDGGSTDGSRELIEKYSDKIDYWVSEHDEGVYQAMNKGVLAANGEYCLFVNSGDQLQSIDTIARIFAQDPSSDIVVGAVENVRKDNTIGIWYPFSEEKISAVYLRDNPIHHPGALIRRSLQRLLPYNENLKICSDRQFFMEALILHNCTYSTIPVVINRFAPAGLSSKENESRMVEEDKIFLSALFSPRLLKDIDCTNSEIQTTSRLLMRHHRLTKIICRANNFILRSISKL